MTERDLTPLGQDILKHWRKYRPQMCRDLQAKDQLLPSVDAAAELTADLLSELASQKVPPNQARELAMEEWAYLPEEKTQPTLPFDPATLPAKAQAVTSASLREIASGKEPPASD